MSARGGLRAGARDGSTRGRRGRDRARSGPLVGLLRPRHANRRAQALRRRERSGRGWRATAIVTCTCRWWQGSSSSHSASSRLSHVGDPLATIPAVALCGVVALYLLGHNGFRLRGIGSVSVPRLVVTMLCLALIPLAVSVPSLVTLAILALLVCGLAAFETATSRAFRHELRAR